MQSAHVADGLQLIGKVLATGVGGVEVRLDHHGEATADHAIALAPAEGRLHARRALVRHALHETHVEANLVPFDHRTLDLEVRKSDARLPRLRRIEDQAVEGVADLCARKRNMRSAMRACATRVQRLCALVFWPT